MGNTKSNKRSNTVNLKELSYSDTSDIATVNNTKTKNPVTNILNNCKTIQEKLFSNNSLIKGKKLIKSKFTYLVDPDFQENKRMNVSNQLISKLVEKAYSKGIYESNGKKSKNKLSYLDKELQLSLFNPINSTKIKENTHDNNNFQLLSLINASYITTCINRSNKSNLNEGLNYIYNGNIDLLSIKECLRTNIKNNFSKYLHNLNISDKNIDYFELLEKMIIETEYSVDNSINNINFIGDSSFNNNKSAYYTNPQHLVNRSNRILESSELNNTNDSNYNANTNDSQVYTRKKDIRYKKKDISNKPIKKETKSKSKSLKKNYHKDVEDGEKNEKSIISIYIDIRELLKQENNKNIINSS